MSSEKRIIVFTIVTFFSILAIQYVMEATGVVPPPPKKPQGAVAKADADKGKGKEADRAKGQGKTDEADRKDKVGGAEKGGDETAKADGSGGAEAKAPAVPLVPMGELVLGSAKEGNPYRLEVQVDQRGAGVAWLRSSRYEAEFAGGRKPKQFVPMPLLKDDPLAPPSLAVTLLPPRPAEGAAAAPAGADADADPAAAARVVDPAGGEVALDGVVWEVVRGPDGKAVQPARRKGGTDGQTLTLRTKVEPSGVVLTKTYTLFPGDDGFSMDLTLASPEKDQSVVYKLYGPHGIPIEGEWYTSTYRDAVFGLADGGATKVATLTADAVVKKRDDPERFAAQPLKYAGVENPYFAVLLGPVPFPTGEANRRDAESRAVVVHENRNERAKSDVGVEITSRPVKLGPNAPVTHGYRVFAGPKTLAALQPFGAEDVAFRKTSWIPGAVELARWVITPLLGMTYELTARVARLFGGRAGNYGLAIILLTVVVRLCMFPLGRKQALAAKKMQDLQPYIKELQEKYKDDKERLNRETFALWGRHGVNPASGCWPALVQLPIFVGLWQALNNSVALRHARFLWIDNLAAPDMLFRFPGTVPFLGDYFNLLPFGVVGLMLLQTKLFSPPPTTPEAEAQQKMMKYMMIFMAFMFYKVPSGLGIYFITSSLWSIGERLLLPKVTHAPAKPAGADPGDEVGGAPARPAKPPGRFARFWEKILEEAQKNPTYRNLTEEKDRARGGGGSGGGTSVGGRDRDRDGRDKGKPRARPGKRR